MKKLFFTFVFTLLVNIVFAQVSKTINVETAGTLNTLITDTEKISITNLTVTGNINARDFSFMNDELSVLSILDIENVTIQYYSGDGGTETFAQNTYFANQIPACAFHRGSGKSSLTSIALPTSCTGLKNTSFAMCYNLKIIKCLNINPPTFFDESVFEGVNPEAVYVPIGKIEVFRAADGWKKFSNIFEYILKVTTKPTTSITLTSALLSANLDLILDTPVSAHGFCWNTSGSPTVANKKIDNGAKNKLGAYSNLISDLSQGTTYYIKAFATDGERTVYGSEVTFTTPSIPSASEVISGDTIVCQGQNTVIYAVPSINYATSYIWTLPTGASGTSNTNSITVNYAKTAISGNITVKGQNEWGDGETSILAVTANLLPANAGVISGNTSVCQGENSVTYIVPAIDNATSYVWTLPTGATGTNTSNSLTVNYGNNSVSGNITVNGQNDCGDGVVFTLPITVNQLPVITVSDKTVICGGSVSLYAITNYTGIGTVSYQWSPSTGLNDAAIANPTATVNTDNTYTVTISTPNSCSATKSLSVTVIPMDKPEIGMVGVSSNNKNLIAWNKPVSAGIESYYIYRETNVTNVYEKIGTIPYDSMSIFVDNQSVPDIKSNKYNMSIFDRNGAESALSDPHKTMHLSINKGQNNTWNLIWEPYLGFNVSTYNIYRGTTFNNLNFIDATSGSSTQYSDLTAPTGDVYYQLEVINPTLISPSKVSISIQKTKDYENTALSTLASYNSSRSNIATNNENELDGEKNNIKIYPNPVKDELKIDFKEGSTFEIMNLMGQAIYIGNLIETTKVQTSTFSAGVYLIRFKTGNTFDYKKLIKE